MSWSTVIIHVTLLSLSCRRGAPPLRSLGPCVLRGWRFCQSCRSLISDVSLPVAVFASAMHRIFGLRGPVL